MHATLESLKSELTQVVSGVSAIGNSEPFSIAHGNWSFPGVTREELAQLARADIELINEFGGDQAPPNDKLLADYTRRLAFLRTNTIPNIWGNPGAGVQAYEATLAALTRALREAFELERSPSKNEQQKALRDLKTLQGSLRSLEAQVAGATTRSQSLDEQITAIERAHQAAEQLPTDLATLVENRKEIARLLAGATSDQSEVTKILGVMKEANEKLEKSNGEARAILDRCDEAYRATTSEGLASAFAERSRKLSASMWVWVGGLIASLALGAIYGSHQLHNVVDMAKDTAGSGARIELWINVILAVLSVAAPVWFAWLATKQIGQRFRLAEDYGYKASISKAYEGYRREAKLLDAAFQSRLFASALTRLDELPLRLVETDTHGSPWHELMASDTVKKALETVPDFAQKVKGLAESLTRPKSPQTAATPAVPISPDPAKP